MKVRERGNARACERAVVVLALLVLFTARAGHAQRRTACDVCHSEIEFLRQNTDSIARARAVNVTDSMIAVSAHARLTCTGCHDGFGRFPHTSKATKTCASCHAGQAQKWAQSAHTLQAGKTGAACTQCHGIHDVRSRAQLETAAGSAGMNRSCVACHQAQKLAAKSPHASQVLCASCHGAHDTQPATERSSRVAPVQQVETCGACHRKEAGEWRSGDVHASALLTGDRKNQKLRARRVPACTDCHGAHGMIVSPDSTLVQAASERCAECHANTAGPYADTYHGQAKELGSKKAASCADCHSAHNIRRADDPKSTIAKANLTKTCGSCHKTANAAFTKFDPHVDPHETDNAIIHWSYKLMNLLLLGTMGFFGMHTALWLLRLALDARKASKGGDI